MVIPERYLTPSEYLAAERAAERKSEYWDGQIVAMAGATWPHTQIAANLGWRLAAQLEGHPCQVCGSDLRVAAESRRSYYYPDITVVCGEPQFGDEQRDTLLNPSVVCEVLSPSTESSDRGRKWGDYQLLPTLQHYVLVAQDEPRVEVYTRQGEQWLYRAWTDLAAVAELPAIGCRLPLAQVYDRVEFAPAAAAEPSQENADVE
ncbi:MAG: Uma2 family endonuclease [Fimbriimonadaceae bacterium]|nr:Uma2 family endonuclease [Fimbriimonadaceae bacterium]